MAILGIRKRIKSFIKDALGLSGPSAEPSSNDSFRTASEETTEATKKSPFDPQHSEKQNISSEDQSIEAVVSEPSASKEESKEENKEENKEEETSVSVTKEAVNSDFTFAQVEEVLDDMIRPALQNDGGDITLIEIKDNSIYVQLRGACGTCPSSTATMQFGVKNLLNEEFPSMVDLYDITSGTPVLVDDPTMM